MDAARKEEAARWREEKKRAADVEKVRLAALSPTQRRIEMEQAAAQKKQQARVKAARARTVHESALEQIGPEGAAQIAEEVARRATGAAGAPAVDAPEAVPAAGEAQHELAAVPVESDNEMDVDGDADDDGEEMDVE